MTNYDKLAEQARLRFLTYDPEELIRRNRLAADRRYLYAGLLDLCFRLERQTGFLEEREAGTDWRPCRDYSSRMVLLDILCDSRPGRSPAGRWKSTLDFGMQVHRALLEQAPATALERRFDEDPALLHSRCLALGGKAQSGADIAYRLPFFAELPLLLQFWHGDEEFSPRLRVLWDANADQYLRYETMHYALSLLRSRLERGTGERI